MSDGPARSSSVRVLVVEDSEADALLVRESVERTGVAMALVKNGAAAIDFLDQRPPFADVWRPDMILLDLNLPGLTGKDVLAAIKSRPRTRAIPVIVFSSSSAAEDVRESYELGANSFVVKPFELDAYRDAVGALTRFWLSAAELPPPVPRR